MTDHEHEGMKKCTKCGKWKPATAEFFHMDKTMAGGLCSMCKVCRSDESRKYRQKNRDRILERNREYYQKNKDKLAEREREYKQAPVGRLVESIYYLRRKTGATIYVRDMTEEQKETLANQYVAVITLEKTEKELLASSGKKRCSMCDRVLDYEMFYKNEGRHSASCRACEAKRQRKYRQQNKDKMKKYRREYHEKNKDKMKEYRREYYQKNKDKKKEYNRKYRQNKQKST